MSNIPQPSDLLPISNGFSDVSQSGVVSDTNMFTNVSNESNYNNKLCYTDMFNKYVGKIDSDTCNNRGKGWIDFKKKIETYIGKSLDNIFFDNELERVDTIVNKSDNIEEDLKDLIHKRDIFQKILSNNPSIKKSLISQDYQDDKNNDKKQKDDDVEIRMMKKYELDLTELEAQIMKYKKAVIDTLLSMIEQEESVKKDIGNLESIQSWVSQAPSFISKNIDTMTVEEMVMEQIKEYMNSIDLKNRLSAYKQTKLDFLYLISKCDNLFTKRKKCTICTTDDFTHCFVPCGHCFCVSCSQKIYSSKCHICRQNVNQVIKLYIP